MGRKQQAIGAVKTLAIGCLAPRLDMTRFQMPWLSHARDSATLLPQQHIRSENTLATPGSNKLFSESRPLNLRIMDFAIHLQGRSVALGGDHRIRIPIGLADQSDESIRKVLRQLGKVDGLETISALL